MAIVQFAAPRRGMKCDGMRNYALGSAPALEVLATGWRAGEPYEPIDEQERAGGSSDRGEFFLGRPSASWQAARFGIWDRLRAASPDLEQMTPTLRRIVRGRALMGRTEWAGDLAARSVKGGQSDTHQAPLSALRRVRALHYRGSGVLALPKATVPG